MITVGLTGGIACGKSTVAALLRQQGVPVLDADQVAREVVAPGTAGLAAVVDRFGEEVLDGAGALDRRALGAVVVADTQARRDLEAILHPLIWSAMEAWLQDQQTRGVPAAVVEAALMVETGSYRRYDVLVVVRASPATQVARLLATRGLDADDARRWLATQLPIDDKAALADLVIDNDGPRERLPGLVQATWRQVLARGGAAAQ